MFGPLRVADPGFPVGGVDLVAGAWTPEVVTFRKFFMSKQKNLDVGGDVRRARPLDPPMTSVRFTFRSI